MTQNESESNGGEKNKGWGGDGGWITIRTGGSLTLSITAFLLSPKLNLWTNFQQQSGKDAQERKSKPLSGQPLIAIHSHRHASVLHSIAVFCVLQGVAYTNISCRQWEVP